MAFRFHVALSLAVLASTLAGCNPAVRDLCTSDEQCDPGHYCRLDIGFCARHDTSTETATDGSTETSTESDTTSTDAATGTSSEGPTEEQEAGMPPCAPACAADQRCLASACFPRDVPVVAFVRPATYGRYRTGNVEAALQAQAPGTIEGIGLVLTRRGSVTATRVEPMVRRGSSTVWEGALSVDGTVVVDGTYDLTAQMTWRSEGATSSTVATSTAREVVVDKTAPAATVRPLLCPTAIASLTEAFNQPALTESVSVTVKGLSELGLNTYVYIHESRSRYVVLSLSPLVLRREETAAGAGSSGVVVPAGSVLYDLGSYSVNELAAIADAPIPSGCDKVRSSVAASVTRQRFLGSETVRLTVEVTDAGVGTSGDPTLRYASDAITTQSASPKGMRPGSTTEYLFELPAGSLAMGSILDGEVTFAVSVADVIGNSAALSATVPMTRLRWRWASPRPKPYIDRVVTPVALAHNRLFVPAWSGNLFEVDRANGATRGAAFLGEDLSGVSVGPDRLGPGTGVIYAATAARDLYGIPPPLPAFNSPMVDGALPTKVLEKTLSLDMPAHFAVHETLVATDWVDTLSGVDINGRLITVLRGSTPTTATVKEVDPNPIVGPRVLSSQGVVPSIGCIGVGGHCTGPVHLFFGSDQGDYFNYQFNQGSIDAVLHASRKNETPGGTMSLMASVDSAIGLDALVGLSSGVVFQLRPNGTDLRPQWSSATTGAPVVAPPVVASQNAYAIDTGGTIRFDSPAGLRQYRVYPWETDSISRPGAASLVASSDGVLFATAAGELAALEAASGKTLWRGQLASAADGVTFDGVTPLLACDGTLYVVGNATTTGGVIYAIDTGTAGLSPRDWPRAFHDNRNSGFLSPQTDACTD